MSALPVLPPDTVFVPYHNSREWMTRLDSFWKESQEPCPEVRLQQFLRKELGDDLAFTLITLTAGLFLFGYNRGTVDAIGREMEREAR